jgi:alpha-galactosidase
MQIRRRGEALELATPLLSLVLEPARLRATLESPRHGVRLAGFAPRVRAAGRVLEPAGGTLVGTRQVEGPAGPATRVELEARAGDAIELALAFELSDAWPGVVIELALRAGGDAASEGVEGIDVLAWQRPDGELALPGARDDWRWFRMGYQSWTPAAWLPLAGADARGRLALIRRVHFAPDGAAPRRGLHVSDFASELRAPGQPGLALGFLTHRRWLGQLQLEHRSGEPIALRAHCATAGRAGAAGSPLSAERLWLGVTGANDDGVAEWAARSGREMDAPVPARVPSGWCSWYHFFTRMRADDVRRNLAALAPFRGQLETVQIDDGFQAHVGDWLEPHERFPEGVEPLAREIRDAGFRAGLWLAPFLVSRASRVAREHPDWLVRDARGRTVVANYNPAWSGKLCFALDLTHPEVRAWLAHVFARVRAWGFDYLKLDFLYAGLVAGRRHDASVSPVEAYRATLVELRSAAGPDPFFLGCGAPLGPSIGLFEAMRIGPDVAPAWSGGRTDWLYGVKASPSAENSLRNVLSRAALHQRLWLNDPDCVLVRDRETALSPDEVRTLASVIAVSGGLVLDSDDLACASEERQRWLRRLLPPLQHAPRVGPPRGGVPDQLWQLFPDGSALVVAVNLDPRARPSAIEPARFGLAGPLHAWEFWSERSLGVHDGPFQTDAIAPRACRLLRLVPAARRPAVLGSSLHVGAGALEVAGIEALGDGETRVELALPGRREGTLLVLPAAGPPLALGVEFDDHARLSVWSRGPG